MTHSCVQDITWTQFSASGEAWTRNLSISKSSNLPLSHHTPLVQWSKLNLQGYHIWWVPHWVLVTLPLLAHLSRRLRGELLVYQWLRRPSSVVRPSSVRPSVNIFKHLLLWNHWANWTQISYGDSLGWGNESLFKWLWSHDQDGRHAHIW